MDVFWYQFKTFIWKKYSKSKQTKYLGFVKLGVRWAERDINHEIKGISNSEILSGQNLSLTPLSWILGLCLSV